MSAPAKGRKIERITPVEPAEVMPDPPVIDLPAAVAVPNELSDIPELKTEEIARLAYSYWEARGCQGGSADEDWLRAEQELRALT